MMGENSGDNKPCINLVGSYHGFRDKIIKALPGHPIKDPRNNRQSATAKIVIDDLTNIEESDICLVVAPKGKSRGVMSYVEIGESYAKDKFILNIDENNSPDKFLLSFSDKFFSNLDKGIEFILKNEINLKKKRALPKDVGYHNSIKKISEGLPLNIYFHGSLEHGLKEIMKHPIKSKTPKNLFFPTTNPVSDAKNFKNKDYLVVHFPKGEEINRQACFFMGIAWAYDISIALIEENPIPYPPLQAVARRHFRNLEPAFEYISKLETVAINQEAVLMYELFKEFNTKK